MDILRRIVQMYKKPLIALSIFTVVFSLGMGAQSTFSQTNQNMPRTENTDNLDDDNTPARDVAEDEPSAGDGEQVTVESSSVSVGQIRFRGTVLEDVRMVAGTQKNQCHWVSGGYNSGHAADGSLQWFHDPVRAKICRNNDSPTGWVKVAGGMTGRQCFNPFQPKKRPPGPVVKGPVVMVRSFQNLNMRVKAVADVTVRGSKQCEDGANLSGRASARAASKVRVTKHMFVKARGNSEHIRAQIKEDIFTQAKAKAQARLNLVCGAARAAPQPPPPPKPEVIEKVKPRVVKKEVVPEQAKPPQVKEADEFVAPPEEAVAESPPELPAAGPTDVVATFLGASTISSIIYSVIARRFGL